MSRTKQGSVFRSPINRHVRRIGETDGVSDAVAIAWSDVEEVRRMWGVTGSHRTPDRTPRPGDPF